jgi:hypothetical protein
MTPAKRRHRRNRMAKPLRHASYGLVAALWLTGCAWLLLQGFFRAETQFGWVPHPLQSPLLLAHGILAIPALYLFGWISPGHALEGWRFRLRRASGGTLWLLLAVLTLSGFALFFLVASSARGYSSLVHEVLGVVAGVAALIHWIRCSGTL